MEAFENMSKRAKIILSLIGAAAVLVPAALLMITSSGPAKSPDIDSATRQIDQINVGDKKNVSPTPTPLPTPVTTTPPVMGVQDSSPSSR